MQHATNKVTTSNRPAWWNDRYDSAWERVKGALARDLEQTKRDFGADRSAELNQDVGNTVKQALGKEPILAGDRVLGYVTSANFGYTVGKYVLYGYLPVEYAAPQTKVEVQYFGRRFGATVTHEPLFDPKNERMKL